jgi:SAM-dependent methyltransferase
VNRPAAQYDQVAEQYARLVAPRYTAIAALLDAAVGPVASGSTVVELAAGTGTLTRLLAPRLIAADGAYVALDISIEMLRQARETVPPRVELLVADGEATMLATSTADLVVSSLGVLQDTDARWREAARLLHAHGRVVLTMWGVHYAERVLIAEARRQLGAPPMPTAPLVDAVARAARAGFGSIRHQDFRLPAVHHSMADYLEYRAAFGAPPWVPPGRQADALHAIRDAAAPYVNANGNVELDRNVTLLEASACRHRSYNPSVSAGLSDQPGAET